MVHQLGRQGARSAASTAAVMLVRPGRQVQGRVERACKRIGSAAGEFARGGGCQGCQEPSRTVGRHLSAHNQGGCALRGAGGGDGEGNKEAKPKREQHKADKRMRHDNGVSGAQPDHPPQASQASGLTNFGQEASTEVQAQQQRALAEVDHQVRVEGGPKDLQQLGHKRGAGELKQAR